MRKLFTLFLLFSAIGLYAQQLQNSDFEQWISPTQANSWNSINDLIVAPGIYGFVRTTDAQNGQYAAMLKSQSLGGNVIPGVLSTGQITQGNIDGGIPFPHRPDELVGFYKHPTMGNAQIHILFTKYQNGNTDTIGYGSFIPGTKVTSYTQMNIPINYSSSVLPDTMNIVFLTDSQSPADTFIVDNLNFTYTTTIDLSTEKTDIVVYPNPSDGKFYIESDTKMPFYLFNSLGQCIQKFDSMTKIIDLNGLPSSVYYLKIEGVAKIERLVLK